MSQPQGPQTGKSRSRLPTILPPAESVLASASGPADPGPDGDWTEEPWAGSEPASSPAAATGGEAAVSTEHPDEEPPGDLLLESPIAAPEPPQSDEASGVSASQYDSQAPMNPATQPAQTTDTAASGARGCTSCMFSCCNNSTSSP